MVIDFGGRRTAYFGEGVMTDTHSITKDKIIYVPHLLHPISPERPEDVVELRI